MPEAFFAFGRANGVDVTGADCLGYRGFSELAGSEDGFFKLNSPPDQPFTNLNFDIDGNGQADPMWSFRITNSAWSRQVLQFGKATAAAGVGPVASVKLGRQQLQEKLKNMSPEEFFRRLEEKQ